MFRNCLKKMKIWQNNDREWFFSWATVFPFQVISQIPIRPKDYLERTFFIICTFYACFGNTIRVKFSFYNYKIVFLQKEKTVKMFKYGFQQLNRVLIFTQSVLLMYWYYLFSAVVVCLSVECQFLWRAPSSVSAARSAAPLYAAAYTPAPSSAPRKWRKTNAHLDHP